MYIKTTEKHPSSKLLSKGVFALAGLCTGRLPERRSIQQKDASKRKTGRFCGGKAPHPASLSFCNFCGFYGVILPQRTVHFQFMPHWENLRQRSF
jgi:hypothetical protein